MILKAIDKETAYVGAKDKAAWKQCADKALGIICMHVDNSIYSTMLKNETDPVKALDELDNAYKDITAADVAILLDKLQDLRITESEPFEQQLQEIQILHNKLEKGALVVLDKKLLGLMTV